jgi:hypothetical protein
LREAYKLLLDKALDDLRTYEVRGTATMDTRVSGEVSKVATGVKSDAAILHVVAMGYLAAYDPRRFPTHKGLLFQIARQWRALSDRSVGQSWDHNQGRVKRYYKDVAPRVSEALGYRLLTGLGIYGVKLFDMEEREKAKEKERQERAREAFSVTEAREGTEEGQGRPQERRRREQSRNRRGSPSRSQEDWHGLRGSGRATCPNLTRSPHS